ncbi:MAG: SemiSWEET transporter [Hyphomicrobiales bacterium]|nr:SemiSWEET transporter [Hyphomicrobiales bacterium]
MLPEVVGAFATIASITSFTPQAWKILKSRDTRSISTRMYLLTVCGFALWTFYGLLTGSWPLILTNAVCFILSGFILSMKVLPQEITEKISQLVFRRKA